MGDRVPVTPGAETDVFAADIGADPGTQFGEKIGLRAAVAQDAVDPEPGDMVEAEPGDAAGRKVAENAALYSVAGGMDVDGLDDGQPAVRPHRDIRVEGQDSFRSRRLRGCRNGADGKDGPGDQDHGGMTEQAFHVACLRTIPGAACVPPRGRLRNIRQAGN